ncbi:MAG: DUF4080 domain-containing protein [Treponema sp.]|nr:DUF4080 domain-containing protein [Treponema sp.]
MKSTVICTSLLVEKSPQALPLGAACIASAIKNDQLTKDITQTQLLTFSMEDNQILSKKSDQEKADYIYQKLLEKKADIVCFSTFVWNRNIFELTSKLLQKKGIITIAGGPEVTAHPQELKKSFDYVVSGEGEIKVPCLVKAILNKEEINELPANTLVLDNLKSPYLDGSIDPAEFGGALWELARGCPFKCSYCYESKGEKKVRLFPMERIEKELDLFAKKDIAQVFVLDPTYNINKDRAIKLIDLIAKKTPNTFYYFEARAEYIDRQLARAFTKIPCALQIGLQSANEESLKLVNRPFNRKQFTKNIGLLNEEGVIFGLDLIYGLPAETFKSFREGINFALSLYPNNLEIFCLSVLPGTDLFDRAKELKLNFEDKPPYQVINTDKFSAKDIKNAQKLTQACNYFYNDGHAVPWFNTICQSLKMKGDFFLKRFYSFAQDNKIALDCQTPHLEIEKNQIKFVNSLYQEKGLVKYIKAANDIIRFNGALSRKTECGKSQEIQLNYPLEYVNSEFSLNLEFFVSNVKIKSGKVRI